MILRIKMNGFSFDSIGEKFPTNADRRRRRRPAAFFM
jgi:hypothetical protein